MFAQLTITALITFMATSVTAGSPPPGCTQTATGKVGFCLCTSESTSTVLSTSTFVTDVPTVTTTVVPTTITVPTFYVTTSTIVATITASGEVTSTLRGTLCYPSDPASPSS